MNKKLTVKIFNICFVLFSILTLGLLIYQVLDIYLNKQGSEAYSPAIIKEHFENVQIFIYIYLLLIISSFFIKKEERKAKYSTIDKVRTLRKNIVVREFKEDENTKEYQKLMHKRQIFLLINFLLSFIFLVIIALYLFNNKHFKADNINNEMRRMLIYLLPYIIIIYLAFIAYDYFVSKSLNQELDLLIKIKRSGEKNVGNVKAKRDYSFIIRTSFLLVAAVFIILGIINKGSEDVLNKAIAICRECIGLG